MKKPLHMLTGLNLVDYGFDPDTFLPLVKRFKYGKENGDLFKFISVRLVQPENAREPMLVTLSPIVTLVRLWQSANVDAAIEVTLSGISTLVRFSQ